MRQIFLLILLLSGLQVAAQDGKLHVIGYDKGLDKTFDNICFSQSLTRVALEFESADSFLVRQVRFFTDKVYNAAGPFYFYISYPPGADGIAAPVALIDTLGSITPETEIVVLPDDSVLLRPGKYWAVLDFSQAVGASSPQCFCQLLTRDFKDTGSWRTYVQVLKPDDRSLTKTERWVPMSEYKIAYRTGNINHGKIKHRLYYQPVMQVEIEAINK